jgi:outer membrane protein OmpA-like peptidoglycan-associated protein
MLPKKVRRNPLRNRRNSYSYRPRRGYRRPLNRRWLALCLVPIAAVGVLLLLVLRQGPEPSRDNDVLLVVTGTQNEMRPVLPPAVRDLLMNNAERAGEDPPLATVLSVDGDGGTRTQGVDLTPRRGHQPDSPQEESGIRRAAAARANVDLVDHDVTGVVATQPGHALLAGLQAAGRLPGRTIVVCSSGIDTDDPIDLRAFGFDSSPAQLVAYLRRADALPDLHGREIYLALTPPSGRQARLTEPINRDLTRLWTEIIEASGGTVRTVAAGSSVASVGTVPTPPVRVPVLVTPRHAPAPAAPPVPVLLPAATLFQPDSAALIDRAATLRELHGMAQQIITHAATVTIVGHTALDHDGLHGSPQLSIDRARVIEGILRQLGVPARSITQVTGVGPTKPVRQPPQDPGNRVVVVTITAHR